MKNSKIEAVTTFREWLIAQDVHFLENPDTYGQFKIFDFLGKKSVATIWATTELMMYNEGDERVRGIHKIKQAISDIYLEAAQTKSEVRLRFEQYEPLIGHARKLITVTELKSGALEVQINDSDLTTKWQYIMNAYDDQMHLKTCSDIIIRDFIIV